MIPFYKFKLNIHKSINRIGRINKFNFVTNWARPEGLGRVMENKITETLFYFH